jgi:hypothetical protein
MKNRNKTPRQQLAGKKIVQVYAELTASERNLLEETLLKHAFLSAGEAYIKLADWHESYWAAAYGGLFDAINQDVDWAAEISTQSLSAKTVRELILDVVEELFRFQSLECLQP